MDLKEFVTATPPDVLEGIKDAQKLETIGESVAPNMIGGHQYAADSGVSHSSRITSTTVRFDVAVTAEEKSDIAGKLGMKVSVMGIGLEAGGSQDQALRNSSVSRIQFSIPIIMPR